MKQGKRNEVYMLTGETVNEIAAAVNFVNESLRVSDGKNPDGKLYQNGEIRIIYSGDVTLPQFSAVSLIGLAIKPKEDKFTYSTPTFFAGLIEAGKPDVPFAICAEPAKKGKMIKAVLNGITPAKVTIKNSMHEYAKPTPGSKTGALESCETGTARILYKKSGSGEQWCILQLGASAAVDEYNGYFKIVNASTTGQNGQVSNKIKIVDGATYDSVSGTSGKSVCKVNNVVFNIDVFSDDVSSSKVYCLKYTAATEQEGETPASPAKVEIVALDNMPSDTATTAYCQIGRTIVSNGTMKIQQDHKAGVAQIFWYGVCE